MNGLKISVDCFCDNSLVDTFTVVLGDGVHKEDPIEVLRKLSQGSTIKNHKGKINKLKTNWYWNSKGVHQKQYKRVVFGFK